MSEIVATNLAFLVIICITPIFGSLYVSLYGLDLYLGAMWCDLGRALIRSEHTSIAATIESTTRDFKLIIKAIYWGGQRVRCKYMKNIGSILKFRDVEIGSALILTILKSLMIFNQLFNSLFFIINLELFKR